MAKAPVVPPSLQSLITGDQFRTMAGKDGRLSAKETRGLLPPPPKGYKYTYQHSSPNAPLVLKKDSGIGKTLGKIGLIAGGVAATALTGGAASPALAAAIGAGTGAGVGAIDGGWKGALIGAGTGAATGGLFGGAGGAATGAAKQGAGQAVRSALTNPQTLASIGGQAVPGKTGTLLSMIGGAGGGNMAGTAGGFGDILKALAKDPNTYATLGSVIAGAAGGSADERTRQNQAGISANAQQANTYGTQQQALNQILALLERGKLDRAELGLRAPSVRAGQAVRGSLMANLQPVSISHPRATIPKISGGLTPAALSQITRQAGRDLEGQAADAIRTKSDIPEMTDFPSQLMELPELTPYKEAGKGESFLSGAGLIGNIIASLAKQGQGSGMSRTTPPINPSGVGANRDPYAGLFGG